MRVALIALLTAGCQATPPLVSDPGPLIQKFQLDGKAYALAESGYTYERIAAGWQQGERVFDPEIVRRSYVSESNQTYRVDLESGKKYSVRNRFEQTLSSVPAGEKAVRELMGPKNGWTEFTLQTPQYPTVASYVQLRQAIMRGEANFADATISGTTGGLEFTAPACPETMICTKSSISSALPYFRKGDEFWFQAEFKIEGAMPLTLADLEADLVKGYPGIRLRFYDGDFLGVELKSAVKREFRQTKVRFSLGKWVRVRWAVKLHDKAGRLRVWSDGRLVLDQTGTTLPFATAILNNLEVGVTAHVEPKHGARVLVRNLRVSDQAFLDPVRVSKHTR